MMHVTAFVIIYSLLAEQHDIATWPLYLSLITGLYLFGMSACYHLFFCTNKIASCILLRLDYGGVCMIAAGGIIPAIYYGFYCYPYLSSIYQGITISSSLFVWLISLMNFMFHKDFLMKKVMIYMFYYTVVLTPVFHLIYDK